MRPWYIAINGVLIFLGCLAFKATDEKLTIDEDEVSQAMWVPWKPLLEAWRQAGQPKNGKLHEWEMSAGAGPASAR